MDIFKDWESKWQVNAKQSLKTFWEKSYCLCTDLIQRVDPNNLANNGNINPLL